MFVGKANKHTANDNTSGVLTLIEALHEDELKDVCCVFFDHEEVGLFGSRFFYKKHKEELRIKKQAYRNANRDKVKVWSRNNYLKRKEKMSNGEE